MTTQSLLQLGAFVAICLAVGAIGGVVTAGAVKEWYPTLKKPAWTPPGWIFGPVWTVLYVMMGVAGWMVYAKTGFGVALIVFTVQLALNLGWSLIFFGLKRIGAAAVEIMILWDCIAATVALFALVDPLAAGLMLPYFVWVSFASVLNLSIWRLNR